MIQFIRTSVMTKTLAQVAAKFFAMFVLVASAHPAANAQTATRLHSAQARLVISVSVVEICNIAFPTQGKGTTVTLGSAREQSTQRCISPVADVKDVRDVMPEATAPTILRSSFNLEADSDAATLVF
jgi:hypothetical protein